MELILKSAEVNLPQSIANLEQLKAELEPRLEKYNSLVVTEDSIKAAKEDKAALNKLKKAIEEQRISIKKQYLEPYNVLEAQCKEVVKMIEAPIQVIDKQIKAFGEIEKQEKYTALYEAFTSLAAPDWVEITDVLNPKWENKTQKLETLKAEMAECCKKYKEELDKLMEMYKDFPHKLAIENKYKECKDFSKTAVYAVMLESEYKKEQQRKAEEAVHSENAQNEPQCERHESNAITPQETQSGNNGNSGQPESESMMKGRFTIECTRTQLYALGKFIKAQGIRILQVEEIK